MNQDKQPDGNAGGVGIAGSGANAEGSAGGEKAFSAPSISLPKGGGAIRGMGEKFAANPVTGTGSMTVPIATSPGRSGFGPQLLLSYDSGSGNGPFGFGWSLPIPAITRKTDKGLPLYRDAEESDVYLLSGAEDLVPALQPDGSRFEDAITQPGYTIHRYRPRIEGLFARIERWTSQETGEIHWRSISRENITTLYGKTENSRIADPADPVRVYTWLICENYDDKGNAIFYEYKPEDSQNVELSQVHERNRSDTTRSSNRYLKSIRYGNRTPYRPEPRGGLPTTSAPADWLFEVVFDYGEHDAAAPAPEEVEAWACRSDPFSSYRAGFEVRTYRLCQRVLMFHHFPGEPGVSAGCLVRSNDFHYTYEVEPADPRNPIYSFLSSVTQNGYKRQEDGSYLKKSLPPLEFEYSEPIVHEAIHEVDPESLENLPSGLDNGRYQWLDLDGEGLSGILTEQAGGWFYKRNLSPAHPGSESEGAGATARFGPLERVAEKPSLAALASGGQQFLDLAGDGRLDLVMLAGPSPGFFERTPEGRWEGLAPFIALPVLDWSQPNLRFVDLTGDGHADVVISEEEALCWYPSLAEAGFGPAERVSKTLDEEQGPRLFFADETQTIFLGDMSGDGLADIVRIRNGEVCYWPNLGYGRFGAKVSMDNAPWFDATDLFEPRRIRLADIDGSGTTDILYLGSQGVQLYFNLSGNGWGEAQRLAAFPAIDDVTAVQAADLLGNGTACLVWSSTLPGDARRPMRYLDLIGGQKPHLLIKSINNLGAETHIHYAPSTKFYLADKLAGKPWITRIPFPVHVVERVEAYDRISGNRFVTRYAYHHGYFDGPEREFRGFGMVEQWDTEEIEALSPVPQLPAGTNFDPASHIPPVYTKTWFHTGAFIDREHISNYFAGTLDGKDSGEYYREPGMDDDQARALLLDDTVLPLGLPADEERQACRALKGAMLRQEIYALDGTQKEPHPYTVTEQNYSIRQLQPKAGNRHTVFFTHAREAINYHYERNPADPRLAHALTLAVDDFGNVLKKAAIGYGRRQPDLSLSIEDQEKQAQVLIALTENNFTNPIEQDDDYRAPLPAESRSYELTGLRLDSDQNRFHFDEVLAAASSAQALDYEQTPSPLALEKRLIEHVRTLYRPDDLGASRGDPLALLPLGQLESLALPGESYRLAFTPELITTVYGDRLTRDMLESEGSYVHTEGDASWWVPSGRIFLSPGAEDDPEAELAHARAHFFLPQRIRDPFHRQGFETESFVTYDDYDLLLQQTRDALDNTVSAVNDYRVQQPVLVTDPNGNQTGAAFDALGMVTGTAVKGKVVEELIESGDSLDGFEIDLDEGTVIAHLEDPLADPHAILMQATTRLVYDLFSYQRTKDQPQPSPAVVYTLARETHVSDLQDGELTRIQHGFSYSDGFGREIQKKIQAEPGPLTEDGAIDDARWVGSGWTVFNNKGKPVRQFEPFFSNTHRFEFELRTGVSPVLFYDPLQRAIGALNPNHTWQKAVFDAWRQETWDVNDTVLIADPRTDPDLGDFFRRLPEAEYLPTWHTRRLDGAMGTQEQAASGKAAVHAGTPTVAHMNSLGRIFLTIAHNRVASGTDPATDQFYSTRVIFDIEGNQREVIDALDRIVMHYDYDMLGNVVHSLSMDAGVRWMLNEVTGKPVYGWDSRDHRLRLTYDVLRRPVEVYLQAGGGSEIIVSRTVYGETQLNPETLNLRGKVVQLFDQAGVVASDEYDFKGNLLSSRRQLAQEYKTTLDRSTDVALEVATYTGRICYDALNRPIQVIPPHSDQPGTKANVIQPAYNEANLLEQVDIWVNQNVMPAGLLDPATANLKAVTGIEYDAKGQREQIEYGNGVVTTYEYDPLTFRLVNLLTRRSAANFPGDCPQPPPDGWPGCEMQNLHYTYDPIGNITHIRDDAQQTIYFRNQRVEPGAEYTYDAIYQLIRARGREHTGQGSQPESTWNDEFRANLPHPHDGRAMQIYSEQYAYDEVGNILQMIHQAANGNWTRTYAYNEPSLIEETARVNNRLSFTTAGNTTEPYTYDAHGSMTKMLHLTVMQWNYLDQLEATARQVVNDGAPETTWYVYDAAGQRVRKVTERQAPEGETPRRMKERIYLGGFEIYREYDVVGNEVTLERETLHVMDDRQRIAMVETRTSGDDGTATQLTRYQMGNHLGSASLELDEVGRIISYEEYYPYGSTSYQAVDASIRAAAKRYRYTGKERDEETGLAYHGARYYALWLGRWTSCDPKAEYHTYSYSVNNPVIYVDANGKEPSRSMAVTPEVAVEFVRKHSSGSAEQTLESLGGSKGGPLEWKKAGAPRYVYTEKAGWIDFKHFFFGAAQIDTMLEGIVSKQEGDRAIWEQVVFEFYSNTSKWSQRRDPAISNFSNYPRGTSIMTSLTEEQRRWWLETSTDPIFFVSLEAAMYAATVYIEEDQAYRGLVNTTWSYEDAPSNYLGLYFWFFYYDPKGDLADQFDQFLKDLSAVSPDEAPNWEIMWEEEKTTEQQFQKNYSIWPTLNPTPHPEPVTSTTSIRGEIEELGQTLSQVPGMLNQLRSKIETTSDDLMNRARAVTGY